MSHLSFSAPSLHVIELQIAISLSPSSGWNFQKFAGITDQARHRRHKGTMAEKRRTNKGGHYLRYEPSDMNLINEDPTASEAFIRTRCLKFFQRLQGCHV